jgi:hypothetical protein
MRAILVSVQYHDLLAVTLPANVHHFESVHVVTTPQDTATQEVARACGAHVFLTDAFYRNGAVFNKWLALEEALDATGLREPGWLILMDADVIWPQQLPPFPLEVGNLYSPLRRMVEELHNVPRHDGQLVIPHITDWWVYPIHPNINEHAGYSQIFHTSDQHLGPVPWHETNWRHAGGADSFFQAKWPAARRVRPPFEVLHLGPAGTNWMGRATSYLNCTRPAEAEVRAEQMRRIWAGRRGKQGLARFEHERLP